MFFTRAAWDKRKNISEVSAQNRFIPSKHKLSIHNISQRSIDCINTELEKVSIYSHKVRYTCPMKFEREY